MKRSFKIAAVGASAGGLEALIALLRSLPAKIKAAFVVIQHLEPRHKSMLSEILSRETSLTISQAKNNQKIESGHVYVIPPNSLMSISGGRLKITHRIKREDGKYLPVDHFMISLAKDQKKNAIGIILSGTGSDGMLGSKSIKENGGIVFAQDAKSAKYFDMPGSAIKNGWVDFILDPAGIAGKLIHSDYRLPFIKSAKRGLSEEEALNRILTILRDSTGVDFIHYKQTTINRRVGRRLAFHNFKTYFDYLSYLQENPAEMDILVKDILIPVTAFFRDADMFVALGKIVFPSLASERAVKNTPIRVWVPACSTGEEVYSIAIALCEFLEKRKIKPRLQIFGTDLSAGVVEKARAAVYGEDISRYVSPERLRRFFIKTEEGYKIAKYIRDFCIFAAQDVTNDPPLSNMDIISCRNFLIYLDSSLQSKVLSMLHYALKLNGFLVLGTAESVSPGNGFFTVVNGKHKIFSKNVAQRSTIADVLLTSSAPKRPIKARAVPDRGKLFTVRYSDTRKGSEFQEAKISPVDTMSASSRGKNLGKIKSERERVNKRLRGIIEEKDTLNEELKVANEEIQSSNEELQSMNEELETSKEELQSTNEELLTLNEELQNKNAELTQLNNDLNNFFSSTNIPIIMVGNDLRVKRFTPVARKVMNLIATDIERPIGDIKLKIDIVDFEEMILDVIETMLPKEIEAKDKEGRCYTVFMRPYRTVENKIDGAVIAMMDITERKHAENIKARLAAIVESSNDAFIGMDLAGTVTSWNSSAEKIFGYSSQEVIGQTIVFFTPPSRRGEDERLLDQVANGRRVKNYDTERIRKDGITIPVSITLSPIRDSKDRIIGVSSVINDISDRKRAEEMLVRDKEMITALAKEQSLDLIKIHTALERSKRLSDIGTLSATVAHELRNPLAAISMAATNIGRKTQDVKVKKHLQNIDKKVKESAEIINNLLSYSRIKPPELKKINIHDILEECIDSTRKLTTKSVHVSKSLDALKDVYIEGDPHQMQQVFLNLLNNAYDAVRESTGEIDISAEENVDDKYVKITIKDNGEGIKNADLPKVFDPFFTTKIQGTGLGLSVCQQIIHMHGGEITIESELGKGSAVTITLPRKSK